MLKEVGKGTGLGLSTVFGIVRQHKGMITVYSEVGIGTTFKIYLPAIERLQEVSKKVQESPIPLGNETILLADDNEGVLSVAKHILERAGYTILTACDGEEALRVFEERENDIDLALLDVVMPKLGGRAVYDRIHKERPDIPILFASGYSATAIHDDFVLADGMQLIQKPYHRVALLKKVREILDA